MSQRERWIDLQLWHNGYDTVVAKDIDDARSVSCDLTGETNLEDVDGDGWTTLDPDEPLTIRDWHADGRAQTMTGWDWMITNGRGFLCSTET